MTRTVFGWIGSLLVCLGLSGLNGCGNPSADNPPESESVTTDDLDIELPSFDAEGGAEVEGTDAPEGDQETESAEEDSSGEAKPS